MPIHVDERDATDDSFRPVTLLAISIRRPEDVVFITPTTLDMWFLDDSEFILGGDNTDSVPESTHF